MTVESAKLVEYSKRLDDAGKTGFYLLVTGTTAKRQEILAEAIAYLTGELKPAVSADCPRAPGPFRYCPDCDGSFPCEMPGSKVAILSAAQPQPE